MVDLLDDGEGANAERCVCGMVFSLQVFTTPSQRRHLVVCCVCPAMPYTLSSYTAVVSEKPICLPKSSEGCFMCYVMFTRYLACYQVHGMRVADE